MKIRPEDIVILIYLVILAMLWTMRWTTTFIVFQFSAYIILTVALVYIYHGYYRKADKSKK